MVVSQKLPVNGFKWVKSRSQFNEDFVKNYNGDEGHFLDQYPEELHKLHNDLLFLLVANFHEKKHMLFKWEI